MTTNFIVNRSFTGKVALIAGASRGIGAVSARAFADAGAAVVLAARDGEALDVVAKGIQSAGGQALALPTDVGDLFSFERLVQQTMSRFGRLDVAFNNATDNPLPAPLAWLCSDHASFITGATIPIDGGQYAGLKPPRMYSPGKSEG